MNAQVGFESGNFKLEGKRGNGDVRKKVNNSESRKSCLLIDGP